jgi:membrane protease YdiL (CAAX protease family)
MSDDFQAWEATEPIPATPPQPLADETDLSEVPEVLPVRKKGWPILSWIVILLLVTFIVFVRAVPRKEEGTPTAADPVQLRVMELQSRNLVGTANLFGNPSDQTVYRQAQMFNTGPVPQRLRFIVLAGELAGPGEALAQLRALDEALAKYGIKLTEEQAEVRNLLERLYRDYQRQWVKRGEHQVAEVFAAPKNGPVLILPALNAAFNGSRETIATTLSAEEQTKLRNALGWFGELALAPPDSVKVQQRQKVIGEAQQTTLVFLIALVGAGFLGLCGFVGLLLLIILWLVGKVKGGLQCGSPYAGVYAETFALWMILFLGLTFATQFVSLPGSDLFVTGMAILLSLSALAWPVLRGIPWRQVRQDIGLIPGRNPALEPALGFGVYAMALPILAIGLILTLILMFIQSSMEGTPGEDSFTGRGQPSHPIVEQIFHFGWWGRVQLFLLASVVAPIVEETMFRGVLYRQLREATYRVGGFGSVVVSATIVSFIFAVIHPQGLVAVPALMSLAYAFTLAREWRVTLIPSMVAHGINNGVLMLVLILALGG